MILLWLETLAVGILGAATLLACASRLRGRRTRRVLAVGAVVAPLVPYGWLVGTQVFVHFRSPLLGPDPRPFLALLAAYVVGAAAIFVAGTGLGRRARRILVDGDPASPSPPRPASLPAARWPRGKLAALLGVAVVLHSVTFRQIGDGVGAWLEQVHVEAGAIALSAAGPPVDDRNNADLLYREVARAYEEAGLRSRVSASVNLSEGSPVDWTDPAVTSLLEDAQPILGVLRAASEYPAWRPQRAALPSDAVRSNHVSFRPIRDGFELLLLDARARLRENDVAGAIEDLDAAYRIIGHVSDLRLVVYSMLAVWMESALARNLPAMLEHPALLEADLDGIEIDPYLSHIRAYDRGLRVEEASALATVSHLFSAEPANFYGVFYLPEDLLRFREKMTRLHELNTRPYYEVADELQRLHRPEGGRVGILGIALGAVGSRRVEADSGEAWRALSRVAVAVRRHELATGTPPGSLDDLVPERLLFVPRDPFHPGHLRYAMTDDHWTVYSVGRNGTDEGGGGDADLAIRVARREP